MSADKKYQKLVADYDKHCLRVAQATTINIHESPHDKLKRIKMLERDYVKWFEYYFPNYAKNKCASFQGELANFIIKHRTIRTLVEWFRSAAKSVHVCLGIPMFLYLVKNELHFMLLFGETEPKAKQLLSGLQSELQHNNRIINRYPI